jgi:uncharacterized membrane protein YhaH (DUF805 family)
MATAFESPPLLADPAHDPWPWRMLLDPRGRIGRGTWWVYGLAAPIGAGLLLHVLLAIARVKAELADHVVNLLLLWPTVAVSVKRWHDRNLSGWWVLVALLPVIGWAWALVANGLLPGTPGPNRFGPEPASRKGR